MQVWIVVQFAPNLEPIHCNMTTSNVRPLVEGTLCLTQASDEELTLAHTKSHVRDVDGPPKGDEWLIGDNYYSPMTPVAARMAAGCTVKVRSNFCTAFCIAGLYQGIVAHS